MSVRSDTAVKEEYENRDNEAKKSRCPERGYVEQSEPEDDRATTSRESPSPCSHGKVRCSAQERKSRSRQKKRLPPKLMHPYSTPSSPPCLRPLVIPTVPTAPLETAPEKWLLHYRRLKKAGFTVRELKGHHDIVWSVALDGNVLVSASRDTTLRVWNAQSGQELCSLRGHTSSVNAALLLSAEQTRVLSSRLGCPAAHRIAVSGSSDCYLNLWLALRGELLKSMYTYNPISTLAVLNEDCLIVVGTEGGKIEVWDVVQAVVVSSVIGHEGSIAALWVDGPTTIVTGSSDRSLKVWQFLSGELCAVQVIGDCVPHGHHIRSLATDGYRIFVGADSSNLKVINWSSGRIDRLRNHPQEQGSTQAVFIKAGLVLASSCDLDTGCSAVNMRMLPGGDYVGTLRREGQGKAFALASDIVEDITLRIVTGGIGLSVWDWTPQDKPGDHPVVFLEALAECASGSTSGSTSAESDHEEDKLTGSPERRLLPFQESRSWFSQWCSIM
ncbi:hypothetical protein HPB47_025195 [Ixodes persulcatus]|uniref:Uncharacterized protein n=1 Tax=Ixodes persulcatus TaxID=34615 RepID=A0AC60Q403_IXOPE|nr:hypothetical protein HPB47_025195 [Ixodes persulcatus]